MNGIPSSNKNLHKHRDLDTFMKDNQLNVFLETGCTTTGPRIINMKWKVCQNNPVEKEKNF